MSRLETGTTLVIGLGEVGRPLFEILRKHEPETIGIDLEPVSVTQPIGFMHVCFPFVDAARFQSEVVDYAARFAPQAIVINSTVVPGVTRAIESATAIPCVYSPIRGKHIRMVDELHKYVKFVAGVNAQTTARVMEHFQSAGLTTETMSTPEALELAKLLETTYFGLLIAWAQEMNRFAESLSTDYFEVGKFFREISYLPNVLFQPGYIGGHCVIPNIALLQQRFESDFLSAIKNSNEARKAELLEQQQQATDERLQPLALV